MKSHPGVAAQDVPDARRPRHQRPHDRHLADQGVVRDHPRARSPRRSRRCTTAFAAEIELSHGAHDADLQLAVVGATGAVGPEVLRVLEERRFPAAEVVAFASARSAGQRVRVRRPPAGGAGADRGRARGLRPGALLGRRRYLATVRARGGAPRLRRHRQVERVSAWTDDVPLVVPEVNPETADGHRGIVANPNCSTIQLVTALKPIHDAAGIDAPHRSPPTKPSPAPAPRPSTSCGSRAGRCSTGDPPTGGVPSPDRVQRASTLRRVRW